MMIKSDHVSERCNYLTAGKEYDAVMATGGMHVIVTDTGQPMAIWLKQCASLDGRAWDIVC